MSTRNPIYDTPTPAERAAIEKREKERRERNSRPGPVETAISDAFSAAAEWVTSGGRRSGNAETDQQGIARRAREKQDRIAATPTPPAQPAVAAPTAEERAFQTARNTRVDRLTPDQRRLIQQGRPDAPKTPAATPPQQEAAQGTAPGGVVPGNAVPFDGASPASSTKQEVAKGTAGTAGTAAQGAQGVAAADKSLLPLPKVVVDERLRGEGVNTNLEEYERDSQGSNTGVAKATTSNQAFSVNRRQGQSFNIGRFRAEVSGADSVLPTHSFLVVFAPMPWAIQKFPTAAGNLDSILTMRCDNVVLPSINLLQEQNIRRYGFGPVENVPYGVNVGDFTLQFIVDKNAFVVQFFEEWLNKIVNRDSFGGANMNNVLPDGRKPYEIAYKDTYACSSINVFVYDRSQNNVMEYNIYDAFPTGIQSMNMSWSEENELMKLNITFSFTDVRIKQSPAKKKQDAPFADEIKVTAKGKYAVSPFASGVSLAALDPSGDIARRLTDFSNETVTIGDGFRTRGSVTPVQLNTPTTSQTADVPVPKDYSTLGVLRINIGS
jgi:hypothetical protein